MITLITGGSKCGKSHYAEKILENSVRDKIYIATMKPYGEESYEIINRHRKMRSGKNFRTIEKYTDIHEIKLNYNSSVLIECIGNLCANEMFCGDEILNPVKKITDSIKSLSLCTSDIIIVTNQVGSDGIEYSEGTQKYIKAMGEINRDISGFADCVIECVYGIPIFLKGSLLC